MAFRNEMDVVNKYVGFLKVTLLGAAFFGGVVASSSAFSDLIEYSYKDPSGNNRTSHPGDEYINPVGEVEFYLSAGVDRRVRVEFRKPNGTIISGETGSLLGADDTINIGGRKYYGQSLKLLAPGEGSYSIVSFIIDSDGEPVAQDEHPVVIDTTPPSVGEFSADGSGYRVAPDGRNILSRYEGKYVRLSGVRDSGSGVDRVDYSTFVLKDGERSLYSEGEVPYYSDDEYAQIGTGGMGSVTSEHIPHSGMSTNEINYEVYDRAGNKTSKRMTFYNNSSCGPMPVAVALEDPQYEGTFLGLPKFHGFRPISPSGSNVVRKNPLKVIVRVPRENFRDLPEGAVYGGYIAGRSYERVHTDSTYAYLMVHGPLNKQGNLDYPTTGWTNNSTWRCGPINIDNVSFTPQTEPPNPKLIEAYIDGVGWVDNRYSANLGTPPAPRNTRISKFRYTVEPRAYAQRGELYGGYCIIPAYKSQCIGSVNLSFNKAGTASQYHARPPLRQEANHSLYERYNTFIWEWDAADPYITSVDMVDENEREVKFKAVKPFSGNTWNRVRMERGGVLLRSQSGELTYSGRVESTGDTSVVTVEYAAEEDGLYDLVAWVEDYNRNRDEKVIGEVYVDITSPQVEISSERDDVKTLDEINIYVSDDRAEEPEIVYVELIGGPADEKVMLAARPVEKGKYKLEYPIIFPTLVEGEEYTLSVVAKDDQHNTTTDDFEFVYNPPRVEMSYGDGYEAYLPALKMPFYRPGGARIIESKPLYLGDGTPVVGRYELIVSLRSDAEVPLIINGKRIDPGENLVINDAYDFSANDSKISVTAYPAEDGVIGTSSLLLSTTAPNAPVLLTNITTWLPDIALTSERWEVKQLVDLVDIRAEANSETTCRVTMDPEEARTADPIADPVCLMEWTHKPIETEVVAAGSGEGHISKLFGNAITLGDQDVAYELFLFSATGEKMKVGEGSRTLSVVDASDSVHAAIVPELEQTYRHIRPISGVLREESRSRCSFFSNAATAKTYGQTIPYDSPQLACHLDITALPDGVEERPGSRPAFSGHVSELGEASISWDITAFSRTGVEVLVGRETHPFDVIEPPVPEIDFLTDNSERRAFETEDREPGIPEDELITVPYANTYLGKAFYRSGPGALTVEVRETGAEEALVADRFGVPMAERERLVMSRIKADETYPLFSEVPLTIEARYTDHPTLGAERQVDALVVPGERVQPYLFIDDEDRTVLNTDQTRLRVEIGDPRHDGPYSAERMGEWDVRLVNEINRDEYVPLTDFQHAQGGMATFDVTLDPEDTTARLKAEARLRSPVDAYQRTEFSTSPLYVTVLEGNPLEAEIETRTLSGPAPYRGIFQLDFATTDELRASGAIEWRVREEGGQWEIDQRGADDRKRLRKVTHFETPGIYEVEARVTNRHSGATSLTQKARIIVYEVPTLTLEGPRSAFVGDEATFTARVEDDEGNTVPREALTVEWSSDLGRTWTPGELDTTISRDEKASVHLWVRVKPEEAPADDRNAWQQENTGISFREEKDPRFYVRGPREVEAGKEYEFAVTQMPPYLGFNRELEGYFTLPDGTRREDVTEFTYTPSEADLEDGILTIRYTGWVEGYRDQTTVEDVFETRVWEYVWPVWGMYIADDASVAPAEVLLRIRQITRTNRLEGLTYEWELDPRLEELPGYSGLMRKVIVPEPGSYSYKATISDARGNETVLEGELSYGEPEPFTIEQRRYYSNRYMRDPLEVSVSPRVEGGHPRDFVRRFEFEVNGTPVEDATRNARLTLGEGSHEILVRMISDHGEVVESTDTVEVTANQPPTCELELDETSTSWRYRANCRDEDGRIHDYEWTLNGQVSELSGYGLSVSKNQFETKPHVVLRGIDDSGDYSRPVSK